MKTKPILFSTPMVQAILEGRKTQTRRIIKGFPTSDEAVNLKDIFEHNADYVLAQSPYGIVGDILWVRETFGSTNSDEYLNKETGMPFFYKADITPGLTNTEQIMKDMGWKWKPSIFMPKEACRLFLEVNNVRVERLQDISESDAIAEGINPTSGVVSANHAKNCFQSLWQMINGTQSWHDNPWVWVYDFKRVERPENFLQKSNA